MDSDRKDIGGYIMFTDFKKRIVFCLVITIFYFFQLTNHAKAQQSPQKLLLKNFRPKSIYNIPRTKVSKAKYPAIDVHSHPYAKGPEQIEQWVKIMDEVGIEKTIILSHETGVKFDSIYAEYAGKYPDCFEVWCGFDYRGYDQPGYGPAAVAELERCHKVGAKGVGELGDKGKGLFYSGTKHMEEQMKIGVILYT